MLCVGPDPVQIGVAAPCDVHRYDLGHTVAVQLLDGRRQLGEQRTPGLFVGEIDKLLTSIAVRRMVHNINRGSVIEE